MDWSFSGVGGGLEEESWGISRSKASTSSGLTDVTSLIFTPTVWGNPRCDETHPQIAWSGMDHLQWTDDRPNLRNPVLVVAFEGWNDAGDAASICTRQVVEHYQAKEFAAIDPEAFYDFTSTRPLIRLNDAGERYVEWPTNTFSAAILADTNRDLIILTGIEPELRWRTFSRQITDLAQDLKVEIAVTVGSLIADVTHTRPTTVYGTSSDSDLCKRLHLEPSNYEGPTGIIGVLNEAFKEAGIPSMSLWATVPSYVPHAPAPKAALALLDRLSQVLDSPILRPELVEQAAEYDSQLNELVSKDDDTQRYVSNLEERYDSALRPESSDGMIEDLEQFLREQ